MLKTLSSNSQFGSSNSLIIFTFCTNSCCAFCWRTSDCVCYCTCCAWCGTYDCGCGIEFVHVVACVIECFAVHVVALVQIVVEHTVVHIV